MASCWVPVPQQRRLPGNAFWTVLPLLPLDELCRARVLARCWREKAERLRELPAFGQTAPAFALRSLPLLAHRFAGLAPGSLALHLEDGYMPRDLRLLAGACGELLGELSLSLVEGVSEGELVEILRGCRRLRGLDVADYDLVGGRDMKGRFLQELPPSLHSLRLRVFPSIADVTFLSAIASVPSLSCLELEGLDELNSDGLSALAGLPQLTELRLAFTKFCSDLDPPQISEMLLLFILRGCATGFGRPGLRALDFSVRVGSPLHLSNGGAPLAEALSGHRALSQLSLSGVAGFSDAGLEALANACPELRSLALYRPGEFLTSEGLFGSLLQLKQLERLSLGCVAEFSEAFEAVCAACNERLLQLEMTRYFRSAGAAELLSVLRRLRAFLRLDAAVFRGTFSAEQAAGAAAIVASSEALEASGGPVSLQRLDAQTFRAQLGARNPAAISGQEVSCHVLLERCFQESDFAELS